MQSATGAASGKGAKDENFPVASRLIAPRHRGAIVAFYDFVRAADDVADHPTLTPPEKLHLLDQLEASLIGRSDAEPVALPLRAALRQRDLPPRHALDLLDAFRLDVRKQRYASWDDLIDYCRLSAMPVGRYVLDVHGESPALWALNDPLCAALQVINHLQDCREDYRDLDRVYIPLSCMDAVGADVRMLAEPAVPPPLRRCLADLAARTRAMLSEAEAFSGEISDWRLSLEVAVIHALAVSLADRLRDGDPLDKRTRLGKSAAFAIAARAISRNIGRRGVGSAAMGRLPT